MGNSHPANPLDKVKLKATDNRRERRLREGEYERLREAARTRKNADIERVIVFAVETAMRRGEILSLRWEQVDLKRRSVTILESKNGYSRTIPLTSSALALLQGIDRTGDRVFPLAQDALRSAWERLMTAANIHDLHFHDLRHEAISRFFEMNLSAPEVASISGHRDVRMLLRYAHSNCDLVGRKIDDV